MRRKSSSEDVNSYLRATTGEDFSAKDFRTWGGTVLALSALLDRGPCETEKEASLAVVEAVKQVSSSLGNRPATCRKFYVHPLVIESYLKGSLTRELASVSGGLPEEDPARLRRLESQVLRLLQGKGDA
jgi:DNA topoisomerase-1